jgi:C4-dicarboxylate-specific signal transduction histidine kinase
VAAADLGRELLSDGVPPESVAEMHAHALGELAKEHSDLSLGHTAPRLCVPLLEVMMAYGHYFRERAERDRKRAEAERQRESEQTMILRIITAGVAHEINNPLTAMRVFAQRIAGSLEVLPGAAALRELALDIDALAVRIRNIVDGMRTIGLGGENLPMVEVSLTEVIEEAVNACRVQLDRQAIRLTVSQPAAEVVLTCNAAGLARVLVNLLQNAADALEGVGDAWIRLEATASSTNVEVAVLDAGPGIPSKVRDSIFVPFFTTKAAGKGTGLGLPLSKSIITAHGGDLVLDTACRNTRFVLSLPR